MRLDVGRNRECFDFCRSTQRHFRPVSFDRVLERRMRSIVPFDLRSRERVHVDTKRVHHFLRVQRRDVRHKMQPARRLPPHGPDAYRVDFDRAIAVALNVLYTYDDAESCEFEAQYYICHSIETEVACVNRQGCHWETYSRCVVDPVAENLFTENELEAIQVTDFWLDFCNSHTQSECTDECVWTGTECRYTAAKAEEALVAADTPAGLLAKWIIEAYSMTVCDPLSTSSQCNVEGCEWDGTYCTTSKKRHTRRSRTFAVRATTTPRWRTPSASPISTTRFPPPAAGDHLDDEVSPPPPPPGGLPPPPPVRNSTDGEPPPRVFVDDESVAPAGSKRLRSPRRSRR